MMISNDKHMAETIDVNMGSDSFGHQNDIITKCLHLK